MLTDTNFNRNSPATAPSSMTRRWAKSSNSKVTSVARFPHSSSRMAWRNLQSRSMDSRPPRCIPSIDWGVRRLDGSSRRKEIAHDHLPSRTSKSDGPDNCIEPTERTIPPSSSSNSLVLLRVFIVFNSLYPSSSRTLTFMYKFRESHGVSP